MSKEIEIAEAVARTINAAGLGINASYHPLARLDTSQAQASVAYVVPTAINLARVTRTTWEDVCAINVILSLKIQPATTPQEAVKALSDSAQHIINALRDAGRQAEHALRTVERDPLVDPERIEEDGLYQTEITFGYSREVI